jgi:hypothetical protein
MGIAEMGKRRLVRFSAINEAWAFFKDQPGAWILAGLVVLLGNWAFFAAVKSVFGLDLPPGDGFVMRVPPASELVSAVFAAVLNGVLLGGLFRLACSQVKGHRISVWEMTQITDVFPQLAAGAAIYGAATCLAATFCFVIPAFVLAGVWMFAIPLIVDGKLRAVDALSQSWRVLKGEWLIATVFHFVVSLLAGIGVCCFGVGLFLTMPLYCLSIAVLYRDAFIGKSQVYSAKPFSPDPYF